LLDQRLGQDTFFEHVADFNSQLTGMEAGIREAALQMETAQQDSLKTVQQTLQRLPGWPELSQEEQQNTLGELENLQISVTSDLAGLKLLLNQDYILQSQVAALTGQINKLAGQRRLERLEAEKEKALKEGKQKISRTLRLPARVENVAQLEELIRQLQAIRTDLALYNDIEVTLEIEE
jgi:hypothetical protein